MMDGTQKGCSSGLRAERQGGKTEGEAETQRNRRGYTSDIPVWAHWHHQRPARLRIGTSVGSMTVMKLSRDGLEEGAAVACLVGS